LRAWVKCVVRVLSRENIAILMTAQRRPRAVFFEQQNDHARTDRRPDEFFGRRRAFHGLHHHLSPAIHWWTMLTTVSDPKSIGVQLDLARVARSAIAPPADLAGLSLGEAYDVQDALVARRIAFGGVCTGWKLGLTNRSKQRMLGIDHPIFGRIFGDGAIPNSRSVSFAGFIAPRAEPELAFGLRGPLDPDADTGLLLAAIAWIAPAIEIADSRLRPGRRSAVELIADNVSSSAYVIGEQMRLDEAPRLDAIGTQLIRSGSVLAAGTTADILGDPFTALRVLARHLAERGLRAAAGDIVLSGAITDGFPAYPGDRFTARLRGIGTASLLFV
jgi:2-keto-4-pentenoate hydratase